MITLKATIIVQPQVLIDTHTDAAGNEAEFSDAFECECGWLEESGIFLNDYVTTPKDDVVIVDALFGVDRDELAQKYDFDSSEENLSLEDAFRQEFGWLSQSGLQLECVSTES